jgi:DnaJ family protein A protein 5
MGAAQSARARGGAGGEEGDRSQPDFTDYYELLSIEPEATADEIKRSYRKLALKHHPDKNPDDVERATKHFHKLQEAFDVLSDEQERAWYDNNRQRFLNGEFENADLDEEAFESFKEGNKPAKAAGTSSPGLTPRHLMRFFDPSLASDLSDSDSSFFGTYRRLFERLAEEDRAAGTYPGDEESTPLPRDAYPSFGYSHTPFAADKKEETVHQTPARDFYTFFMNFQTRKSMGWLDQYRLSEAPDRRVKRLMEKENKRARDAGKREYNDTIRALALFVRKRDPRYKAHQETQEKARVGPEAEANRKAYVEKIERERRARADAFQPQSWQIAQETEDIYSGDETDEDDDEDEDQLEEGDDEDQLDAQGGSGDDEDFNDLECFACDKQFRSVAAFENHEQSTKHKKAVKALQKKMRKEGKALGLDDDTEATDGVAGESLAGNIKAMGLRDRTEEEDEAQSRASISAPVGKSKKAKKKAKKRMKASMASENVSEDEEEEEDKLGVSSTASPSGIFTPINGAADGKAATTDSPAASAAPAFSAEDWEPSYQPLAERPEGSFDVFGFGSLIWKPPPHVIGSQPGYIKGFTRRFAQHSVDHRGTPARPGRVVTLVSAKDWHALNGESLPEGDIVWGVTYTIDPAHAKEVREYLDFREKNGYTPQKVDVYGKTQGTAEDGDTEKLIVKDCLVYVGLPDNEAFIGPSPIDALAERIFTCQGPSGKNDEYLLNLAVVTRNLSPQSVDSHLFELETRVRKLQEEANAGSGRGAELVKELGKPDRDAEAVDGDQGSGKKSRRAKKDKKGGGSEVSDSRHE